MEGATWKMRDPLEEATMNAFGLNDDLGGFGRRAVRHGRTHSVKSEWKSEEGNEKGGFSST